MRYATPNEPQVATSAWSFSVRVVVSVLLLFHLFAMVIAPASNPPPASDLSRALANVVAPYLKFMSLDNGYRFFAPDPGPSHLVRYELFTADGTRIEGVFPNAQVHWPRLLYHRHFMVAEMMHSLVAPTLNAPPDQQLSPRARERLERDRAAVAPLPRGVARNLLRIDPNAQSVRLYLREHMIPSPFDMDRGMKLDDPKLFQELLLGEYRREEL